MNAINLPCMRKGCWGVRGKRTGSFGLCKDHDPNIKSKLLNRVKKAAAANGDGPPDLITGLTPKQAKFVLAWCGTANCNGTRAAREAGYQGDAQTLAVIASTLHKHVKVAAAIEERWRELRMPADEVEARLAEQARADVSELITFGPGVGDQIPFLDLTPDTLERYGRIIQEIFADPVTGRIVRVKLYSAQRANTTIAKIRKLFSDAPRTDVHLHLASMPDADLLDHMGALRSRLAGPHRFTRDPPHPEPATTPVGGDGRKNGKKA